MTEHHGRRVVNKNGKEHLRGQQVQRETQGWGLEVHFPRLPHTSPDPQDSTKELTWKETRTVLTPGMLGYYWIGSLSEIKQTYHSEKGPEETSLRYRKLIWLLFLPFSLHTTLLPFFLLVFLIFCMPEFEAINPHPRYLIQVPPRCSNLWVPAGSYLTVTP